ncbi:MAG: leucine-rich repeat protein [Eubacterium sp.]|nr:leucine-rich repeat protein [Eubacterium sp.]
MSERYVKLIKNVIVYLTVFAMFFGTIGNSSFVSHAMTFQAGEVKIYTKGPVQGQHPYYDTKEFRLGGTNAKLLEIDKNFDYFEGFKNGICWRKASWVNGRIKLSELDESYVFNDGYLYDPDDEPNALYLGIAITGKDLSFSTDVNKYSAFFRDVTNCSLGEVVAAEKVGNDIIVTIKLNTIASAVSKLDFKIDNITVGEKVYDYDITISNDCGLTKDAIDNVVNIGRTGVVWYRSTNATAIYPDNWEMVKRDEIFQEGYYYRTNALERMTEYFKTTFEYNGNHSTSKLYYNNNKWNGYKKVLSDNLMITFDKKRDPEGTFKKEVLYSNIKSDGYWDTGLLGNEIDYISLTTGNWGLPKGGETLAATNWEKINVLESDATGPNGTKKYYRNNDYNSITDHIWKNGISFYDKTAKKRLDVGDTITAGDEIELSINLKAGEGYVIKDDLSVSLDGIDLPKKNIVVTNYKSEKIIRYIYKAPSVTDIVINQNAPVVGEKVSYKATVGNSLYKFTTKYDSETRKNGIEWSWSYSYDDTNKTTLTEADVFESREYWVDYIIEPSNSKGVFPTDSYFMEQMMTSVVGADRIKFVKYDEKEIELKACFHPIPAITAIYFTIPEELKATEKLDDSVRFYMIDSGNRILTDKFMAMYKRGGSYEMTGLSDKWLVSDDNKTWKKVGSDKFEGGRYYATSAVGFIKKEIINEISTYGGNKVFGNMHCGIIPEAAIYVNGKNIGTWKDLKEDYIFEVGICEKIDMSKATVSGIEDKSYTGKEITQKLTVKLEDKELKENIDYKVEYKNNTEVGEAKVSIIGIGSYKGSISKTFKINKKDETNPESQPGSDKKSEGKKESGVGTFSKDGTTLKDESGVVYQVSDKLKNNQLRKNLKIADKKSGGKYKITKIVKDKKTGKVTGGNVEYTAPYNKNCKLISATGKVKLAGVTFTVTSIGNNCAKNCKNLTKVVLGSNITNIGKNAFNGCKKLKTIEIKSKKLKKVGANALKGINKKATIKVPKAKKKAYTKLLKGKGQAKTVKIK